MKTIKSIVAFALLLTSTTTAFANDYALMDNYPLRNDMNMAKQEQALVNDMHSVITSHENNNKDTLSHLKSQFTTIILGLSDGDKKLNLKGTKVAVIKNKIAAIQLEWSEDNHLLDSAVNNDMYQDEAFKALTKLSNALKGLNKLYSHSYARYKQNSVMKSLVSSYMRAQAVTETRYALNNIK